MDEWRWYKTPYMTHIFGHLIGKANYKRMEWNGIVIERGQFVTGLFKLADELGMSVKQVRTCLKRLCDSNEIVRKSASKYSIITICNYDEYQPLEDGEGQTKGKQRATTNKNKNIRSKNNTTITIESGLRPEAAGAASEDEVLERVASATTFSSLPKDKLPTHLEQRFKAQGFVEVETNVWMLKKDFNVIRTGYPEHIVNRALAKMIHWSTSTDINPDTNEEWRVRYWNLRDHKARLLKNILQELKNESGDSERTS